MGGTSLFAALAALVTVGGTLALPIDAERAPADAHDVLLDEIGDGFEPVSEQPGIADSLTRSFQGDEGTVDIVALPVPAPTRPERLFDSYVAQVATVFPGVEPVPEPALAFASWLVGAGLRPGEGSTDVLVFAAREHLFIIMWTPAPDADVDVAGLLVELAERQIAAAGGPPASGGDPAARRADDELLPYLPEAPPPDYGIPARSMTLTGPDDQETDDMSSPAVVTFLNDRAKNVARVWGDERLQVAVGITQYPFEIFAASGVATFVDRELVDVAANRLAGLPDAIVFRDGEGQIAVVFRRGDVLVTVVAGHGSTSTEDIAAALAIDMAEEVWPRLPDGATAPYEFPSPPSRWLGLALAAAFVTVAVAGSTGIAHIRARRARRRWSSDPRQLVWSSPAASEASAATVVPLDEDASALRRRGAVVTIGQLVTIDVGVLALAGDYGLGGVVVATAAFAAGLGFTRWWLRREIALLGPSAPPREFVAPRFWGAVTGVGALAVLGIGASFVLRGVRYVILKPNIAQLRWSERLDLAPRTVGVVFAGAGLVVIVIGGALFRLARALGKARVQDVLDADPRPPALYLRSFDDDSLPLPMIASARRPLFELFSWRGADPFEAAVAWELDSYAPVVAVGRPGRSLASLGAAREHLPHDAWHAEIAERMNTAGVIAVAPGESDGLSWELRAIVDGDHLGKTVFVFPPLAPVDLTRRWEHTRAVLCAAGAGIGDLPASPAVVHTAQVVDTGILRVTTATTRDEATYRTAVDRALELLTAGAAVPAAAPG